MSGVWAGQNPAHVDFERRARRFVGRAGDTEGTYTRRNLLADAFDTSQRLRRIRAVITGSVRKAARSGRIRTEPMISTRSEPDPGPAQPAPGLHAPGPTRRTAELASFAGRS